MKIFSLAILMAGSVVAVNGQDALPRVGVLRAPKNSSWTVTYKYSDEKKAEPGEDAQAKAPAMPRIRSLKVEKGEVGYHEIVTMDDGKSIESWVLPDVQLIRVPGTHNVRRFLPSDLAVSSYEETDFPGLEWTDAKSPTSVKEVNGRKYYLFDIANSDIPLTAREKAFLAANTALAKSQAESKTRIRSGSSVMNATQAGASDMVQLMVDAETRLPVYLHNPKCNSTYSFDLNPSQQPRMDADFQASYDAWLQRSGAPQSSPASR